MFNNPDFRVATAMVGIAGFFVFDTWVYDGGLYTEMLGLMGFEVPQEYVSIYEAVTALILSYMIEQIGKRNQ